jgi:hypothetical protein
MAGSRVTRKREKGMEEGANMRSQVMEMIHLRGLAMKEEITRGLLMGVAAVMTTTRIVISIVMVMKRAMDAGNM